MNTQLNQIVKGLHKYEEPFTPSHWTADELLNHALEETVDTVHYLVGLKELIDQKDEQVQQLKTRVKVLEDEVSFYRTRHGYLYGQEVYRYFTEE